MADQDNKIVQPTVKRVPVRARGPLSSDDWNNFQDQVFSDIQSLSNALNALSNKINRSLRIEESENLQLRRRLAALEAYHGYKEFIQGKTSTKVDRYIDFHDTSSIIFPSSLSDGKRAEIKAQFGEIYLPANGVENKFYNFSLKNGQIVLPSDFTVDVTGIFDKVDGNGIKNYEYGGVVTTGTPENAFNGSNESSWIRIVTFPIESPIEEVECQITAVVPAGISSQANLLELIPFAEGSIDIVQIATAPDLSSAFVVLDTFTEVNNISATRYHFTPRNVEQVRVRVRCRNWREINGKKVFIYGLQEIGLKLVDYSKTSGSDQSFGDNITAVVRFNAPTGHVFNNLYRIDINPNFLLEDAANRHIRLRLSTTESFSNVLWDSSIHIPPQLALPSGAVSLGGVSTIYAIFTMSFVESSGGFQSPFPVGTTPVIKGIGMLTSVMQTANN